MNFFIFITNKNLFVKILCYLEFRISFLNNFINELNQPNILMAITELKLTTSQENNHFDTILSETSSSLHKIIIHEYKTLALFII